MLQQNQMHTAKEYPAGLAIASIPCQKWTTVYDLTTALKEGTIFPDLNMPFYMGGVMHAK